MLDKRQVMALIKAGLPVITIECPKVEEPLVVETLLQEYQKKFLDIYTWDSNLLLRKRVQDKSIKVQSNPGPHPLTPLLDVMSEIVFDEGQRSKTSGRLFILQDVCDLLAIANKSTAGVALYRKFVDIFQELRITPHRIILIHQGLGPLQESFKDLLHEVKTRPTTHEEIAEAVEAKLEEMILSGKSFGFKVEIEKGDEEYEKLLRSFQGMSTKVIEETLQLVGTQHRSIGRSTVQEVLKVKKQRLQNKGITFAPPPDVEIQGVARLALWAENQIPLFNKEEREKYGLTKPPHVLLMGVAGVGKSLAVKAISQKWAVPCISFDLGSLMTNELGKSEANLRQALAEAEALAPCILWVDEMDKQFAMKGSESDGGTTSRIISKVLNWLQECPEDVVVIATANRVTFTEEMLDRFKTFILTLPDKSTRTAIWKVQLQRFHITLPDKDISLLADRSEGYTGREIKKIAEEAAGIAFAKGTPTQVSIGQLNSILASKPGRFCVNKTELNELYTWASNGGAEPAH